MGSASATEEAETPSVMLLLPPISLLAVDGGFTFVGAVGAISCCAVDGVVFRLTSGISLCVVSCVGCKRLGGATGGCFGGGTAEVLRAGG